MRRVALLAAALICWALPSGAAHLQQHRLLAVAQGPQTWTPIPSTPGQHVTDCVTTSFISPTGNDTTGNGSSGNPWLSINKAMSSGSPKAGMCISAGAGTYNLTTTQTIGTGGAFNGRAGYVTLLDPSGTHAAIFKWTGTCCNDILDVTAPYVVIDGPKFDGNGETNSEFCIDNEGVTSHHFIAINVWATGCGATGIQTNYAEYYAVMWNQTDHNAGTNTFQASGISSTPLRMACAGAAQTGVSWKATAGDNAPIKAIYAHNLSFLNLETFATPPDHSDGNGIIVDWDSPKGCQTEKSLILGNAAYSNGGAGIKVVSQNGAKIYNNSTYNDFTDTNDSGSARAEFFLTDTNQTQIVNDIGQSVVGAGVLSNNSSYSTGIQAPNTLFGANGERFLGCLSYNGTAGQSAYVQGAADAAPTIAQFKSECPLFGQDPKYTSLVTPTLTLQSTSPGKGTGQILYHWPMYSLSAGAETFPPNIGAY